MPDGVTIIDTPPPSAPPAPTRTVLASSIAPPAEPAAPKRGSAMERLQADLRAKFPDKSGTQSPAASPPQAPQAGESANNTPAPPQEEGEGTPAVAPAPSAPQKKLTLGQALDNYKKRNRELEAELAEWKTKTANVDTKSLTEKATTLETRNKELEDEIRYINYQKSSEFKDKYLTPYNNAWKRAMADVKEFRVPTEDGEGRAFTANDMLELVNMPIARAREVAKGIAGDAYEEIMGHRKDIKALFDEQEEALKEARANGEAREKARNEQFNKFNTEIGDYINANWEKASEAYLSDPKYGPYFKPIEGDAEGNQRLAKGYELVDRAFNENPKDPRLNAEQRLGIIKRHAAVRHRAAGFGRLAWQNQQKDSRIAQLEKKLAQYEGSTPPAGGGNGSSVTITSTGSAKDSVFGALRSLAK